MGIQTLMAILIKVLTSHALPVLNIEIHIGLSSTSNALAAIKVRSLDLTNLDDLLVRCVVLGQVAQGLFRQDPVAAHRVGLVRLCGVLHLCGG